MHTLTLDEIETLFRGPARVEPKPARVRYVLPLAPLVVSAPVEHGRCCADAVRVPCVCIAGWTCSAHGESHYGSHD